MAEKTDMFCGNCGRGGKNDRVVLFCDNEFTNEYCTACGAANLFVALPKLETRKPCKDKNDHDFRIAKGDLIFCPICYTEFGKLEDKK